MCTRVVLRAAESQDAVGCILAPNVVNGRHNERVAPNYNPWDVSNRLGAHFCTCTKAWPDKVSLQQHACIGTCTHGDRMHALLCRMPFNPMVTPNSVQLAALKQDL
jgi:hypothetical protein